MKEPSFGKLVVALLLVVVAVLVAIGAPHDRPPPPVPSASYSPVPTSVAARGFTLTSVAVDLPLEEPPYPDGPHADVINQNCTACHSASMALTQPKLSADQWKAIVTKMRDTYHAPVTAADVPAIIDYLTAMPSQRGGTPAPGKAEAGGGAITG